MKRTAGGGEHLTIDPYQQSQCRSVGLLNIKRSGLQRYHRHQEQYSFHALPRLHREGRVFRLIFLDGSHRFELTFLDVLYADLLLEIGGLLIMHDTWLPSVRKVLNYVLRTRKGQYELVDTLAKKANLALRAKQTLSLSRQHLKEPLLVWTLASIELPNMIALRKLSHYDYSNAAGVLSKYHAF